MPSCMSKIFHHATTPKDSNNNTAQVVISVFTPKLLAIKKAFGSGTLCPDHLARVAMPVLGGKGQVQRQLVQMVVHEQGNEVEGSPHQPFRRARAVYHSVGELRVPQVK